jgi:hypothetical protein
MGTHLGAPATPQHGWGLALPGPPGFLDLFRIIRLIRTPRGTGCVAIDTDTRTDTGSLLETFRQSMRMEAIDFTGAPGRN